MPYFGNYAMGILSFTDRKIGTNNFEDFYSPVISTDDRLGKTEFLSVEEFGQLLGGN